jgi:hypothetical protein
MPSSSNLTQVWNFEKTGRLTRPSAPSRAGAIARVVCSSSENSPAATANDTIR